LKLILMKVITHWKTLVGDAREGGVNGGN
jgi:hypothetical protein